LPARQSILKQPEFANDPARRLMNSFGSIVSPYLAAPAGRQDRLRWRAADQQAIFGKISPKDCLDRFADILKKEMS
jgi:hypothetical protein